MTRRSMKWVAAVAALAVLTACSSSDSAKPSPNLAVELAGKVGADGMYTHLTELQKIADANDGSRANGTPGYDASLDYAVRILRDKGFDVQTPEFDVLARNEGGNPQLTIGGRN